MVRAPHPYPAGKSRFVGEALARKLWDNSVKLTGMDYGTPRPEGGKE